MEARCMLRPQRRKCRDATITQSHIQQVPDDLSSSIFVFDTKTHVGRRPGSNGSGFFKVTVPEEWLQISGLHVTVYWENNCVMVEDKSSNGTFLGSKDASESCFKRIPKGKPSKVEVGMFLMLAQWPAHRDPEDVLIYKIVPLPDGVNVVSASGESTKNAPGSVDPCNNCKKHTVEKISAQQSLREQQNEYDELKKEMEKLKKDTAAKTARTDKALKDAEAAASAEKARFEQEKTKLAKALSDLDQNKRQLQKKEEESKKLLVDIEEQRKLLNEYKTNAAKVVSERAAVELKAAKLAASEKSKREALVKIFESVQTGVKGFREGMKLTKDDVMLLKKNSMDDVQSMREIIQKHVLSTEAVVQELEKKFVLDTAELRETQNLLEKEVASWRLKAESFANKLPQELLTLLNAQVPLLIQECVEKIQSQVTALNSMTPSQLLESGKQDTAMTAHGSVPEAPNSHAALSQRTICASECIDTQATPSAKPGSRSDGGQLLNSQSQCSRGEEGSLSLRLVTDKDAATPGNQAPDGRKSNSLVSPVTLTNPSNGSNAGAIGEKRESKRAEDDQDSKRRRVSGTPSHTKQKSDEKSSKPAPKKDARATPGGRVTTKESTSQKDVTPAPKGDQPAQAPKGSADEAKNSERYELMQKLIDIKQAGEGLNF